MAYRKTIPFAALKSLLLYASGPGLAHVCLSPDYALGTWVRRQPIGLELLLVLAVGLLVLALTALGLWVAAVGVRQQWLRRTIMTVGWTLLALEASYTMMVVLYELAFYESTPMWLN